MPADTDSRSMKRGQVMARQRDAQEATLSNSIGGGIAIQKRPGDSKRVVSSHLMTSVGAGGCECVRWE